MATLVYVHSMTFDPYRTWPSMWTCMDTVGNTMSSCTDATPLKLITPTSFGRDCFRFSSHSRLPCNQTSSYNSVLPRACEGKRACNSQCILRMRHIIDESAGYAIFSQPPTIGSRVKVVTGSASLEIECTCYIVHSLLFLDISPRPFIIR